MPVFLFFSFLSFLLLVGNLMENMPLQTLLTSAIQMELEKQHLRSKSQSSSILVIGWKNEVLSPSENS